MFLNWFRPEVREAGGNGAWFVDKVTVRRRRHPVDGFVIGGWTLILIKCILASWAMERWDVPIHDFYVWGPSFILGAVCTFLYLRREE